MLARLTLIGLYNYDNTIFDDMVLPEQIDHDDFVNAVLDKGSDFGVMYADADFMKLYVTRWAKRHYKTLERWAQAVELEYNPIRDYYVDKESREATVGESENNVTTSENMKGSDTNTKVIDEDIVDDAENNRNGEFSETGKLDRTEGKTTNTEKSGEENNTTNSSKNSSGTEKTEVTESTTESGTSSDSKNTTVTESGSSSDNTENKVSAFDSSAYSPRDKSESSGTTTNSRTENVTDEGSTGGTKSVTTGKDVTSGDKEESSETGKVTTSGTEKVTESGNLSDDSTKSGNNKEKETVTRTEEKDTTVTDNGSTTRNSSGSKKDIDEYSKNVSGLEKVVATSGKYSVQELINQELELARFEVAERAAQWLVNDICIMVY